MQPGIPPLQMSDSVQIFQTDKSWLREKEGHTWTPTLGLRLLWVPTPSAPGGALSISRAPPGFLLSKLSSLVCSLSSLDPGTERRQSQGHMAGGRSRADTRWV